MMDYKILRYRLHHPKCKYCKYYHTDGSPYLGIFYNHCQAKDIIIYSINIPRLFCPCYGVKEDEF
jgi:hypothetical protein